MSEGYGYIAGYWVYVSWGTHSDNAEQTPGVLSKIRLTDELI